MNLEQDIENPFERTSTPVFNKSANVRDDPYYFNFRSKLEKPIKKATIRGIYGPKEGVINGHFVMQQSMCETKDRNYTYVMRFSREYNSRFLDESHRDKQPHVQYQYTHCTSQILPNMHANYEHQYHVQQPISHAVPYLTPMFFLPVKYL